MDLLPPRFSSDSNLDADDWITDFRAYIRVRKIRLDDTVEVFCVRMSGTARQWIETIPSNLTLEEHITNFRERYSTSDDSHRQTLMSELWNRQQRADEKTSDFIKVKARLARFLNLLDERFTVEAAIQGMREDIRRDVVIQHPLTVNALRIAATRAEACSNRTTETRRR